jgi:hypothetical protein
MVNYDKNNGYLVVVDRAVSLLKYHRQQSAAGDIFPNKK